MNKQYLLDTSVFIEAKNSYYGFKICPGFWTTLVVQHEAKHICSIDRVKHELNDKEDAIKDWIKARTPDSFFKKTEDQVVITAFQRLMKWVYSQSQFTTQAKNKFASVADGWLVAYAMVNQHIVVTREQYSPSVKIDVPIPNLCVEFDVEFTDPFTMLHALGESFVRRTKR